MLTKKEIRERLLYQGSDQKALHDSAREVRDGAVGSQCLIRAVVEITSHCSSMCSYCEMRNDAMNHLERYILTEQQVVKAISSAQQAGIKTVMLQGGEDSRTTDLVKDVLNRLDGNISIILCLGNKTYKKYEDLRNVGAEAYILKLETTDPALHYELRGSSLPERLDCLMNLRRLGYHVGTGIIAGIPGQDIYSIVDDLYFMGQQSWSMCSVSPFIPPKNSGSSLVHADRGDLNLTLNIISVLRLMHPSAVIPSVSALEMGNDCKGGQAKGLTAGANLITINYTPSERQPHYPIYNRDRLPVTLEDAWKVIESAEMEVSYEPSVGPVILGDVDDKMQHNRIVRAFFDERWRENETRFERSIYPFENPRMRTILDNWTGKKRICDVGCGDGRFAIEFALKGCTVHAIDFSTSALKRLQSRANHFSVTSLMTGLDEPKDAREFILEKEHRFELVVIANMLHYLSPLEVIQLIQHFTDHLRSGDQLYIGLETSIQMKCNDSRYFTFAGQYNHSPELINSVLEKVGMEFENNKGNDTDRPERIQENFHLPPVLMQQLGKQFKNYTRDFLLYEFLSIKP